MTDEQKQRRAETARANGRKSKGPITPAGKYRSSMNAISTGQHAELHQEDLPSFFHLLTADHRSNYIQTFQEHLRRLQPTCEFERSLIRRMTIEIFLFDRQTDLAALAAQQEIDDAFDEYPESEFAEQFLLGNQRLCKQRDLLRMINRHKRTHMSNYQGFVRLFIQSKKQLPPIPDVATQPEKEPSRSQPPETNNRLKPNDLNQLVPTTGPNPIPKIPAVRIPSKRSFQMENAGAARKPASPQNVTL